MRCMSVATTITAKGVPPVYGDKQLILVDGRARRFTTAELYRLGGDVDGLEMYRAACPTLHDRVLRSKPGKSLQHNLGVTSTILATAVFVSYGEQGHMAV